MYEWRMWTVDERELAMETRRERRYPKHSPPHPEDPGRFRIITGTSYEHAHILNSAARLQSFEASLLEHLKKHQMECTAWAILPNHYHILVRIKDMKSFARNQGKLHGRTSYEWNREDQKTGRKVWFRCLDRYMRDDAHYLTTLNYLHNNPVKHGYVKKWSDWPFSSFDWYLETMGRDWLVDLSRAYPVLNYGAKWDDQIASNESVASRVPRIPASNPCLNATRKCDAH